MRDIYVIGSYTTVFKKPPGMSWGDLAREAYLGTLSDAGMKNGADIETGWMGNCGMGFWGQNSIRGQALHARSSLATVRAYASPTASLRRASAPW